MSDADLRARIVEAARRWYHTTNEAELAGLVQELEHRERETAAVSEVQP